ncbi:Rv1733c family protein [Streptomyces luteocolor]|uniref:Rv1733c family protein n=1 Tax=Streptomyces luteocolor TaxID=285500 RepID=UPI000853EC6B|nr:hypothetical protein [Streptomyces luteocolor]
MAGRPGTRVRGWRWRRNPLRRRSDVVEAWTTLLLGAVTLIGAPLAGALVGSATYDSTEAKAERQRAERHVVRATLITDAPPPAVGADGTEVRGTRLVTVRWTERDSATHATRTRTATVKAAAGAPAGSRADVWLDARGRVTPAPFDEDELWGAATAAGVGTVFTVSAFGGGTWLAVRALSWRRRMAEWDRAWELTGPRWSGRRT